MGAVDEDPAMREKVIPLALKQDEKGRWWLTHDLREDPIYAMDFYLPDGVKVIR